eukprot:COSAG04_NODE_18567_length_438_cov_0.917404_1_plen_27_part_10
MHKLDYFAMTENVSIVSGSSVRIHVTT